MSRRDRARTELVESIQSVHDDFPFDSQIEQRAFVTAVQADMADTQTFGNLVFKVADGVAFY